MKPTITVAQIQLVHDESEPPSPVDVHEALLHSNVNAIVGKITLTPAAQRDTVRPSWPAGTQPQQPSPAAAPAGQDPEPPARPRSSPSRPSAPKPSERTHRDTRREDQVMKFMRDTARPVARSEITREVDMSQREFAATMGHLKGDRKVVQSGSRGGTRYEIARQARSSPADVPPNPPGVSSARPGQHAIEGATLRAGEAMVAFDHDERAVLDAFRSLAYPNVDGIAKHLDRKPVEIGPVVHNLTERGFLRRHSDGTYSRV